MDPTSLHLIAAAAGGSNLTSVLVILVGSAGLTGILTALLRLPSDRSSSAVTQAQGAMETMVTLNEQLKSALEDERSESKKQRERGDFYKEQLERLQEAAASHGYRRVDDEALRRGIQLHPDDDENDPSAG